jgi:hypothetical protein
MPESAWILGFATTFTNVTGEEIAIGSHTTEGRDNAGYGGLFWRGPRSFTGGTVYLPDGSGDELMGVRAEWMALAGRHDGNGRSSTVVFVDAPDNPDHPVQWFVRANPFTVLCPAPFFATRVTTSSPADLDILVVMQNAGLPEAGDAALDPSSASAARRRRDLAVSGFLALRSGGTPALAAFYEAAARIVEPESPSGAAYGRNERCPPLAPRVTS